MKDEVYEIYIGGAHTCNHVVPHQNNARYLSCDRCGINLGKTNFFHSIHLKHRDALEYNFCSECAESGMKAVELSEIKYVYEKL